MLGYLCPFGDEVIWIYDDPSTQQLRNDDPSTQQLRIAAEVNTDFE
jgi:hypothetical protein